MIARRRDAIRTFIIGYGAPTITCIVFVVYWLLYTYLPDTYFSLLRGLLPNVWSYPFLDLESVLTAIDCARHGVDVSQYNGCMGGGLFQYSPLLLKASSLPLAATQRVPLGLCLDGLFLLSFFALPRPRCWSEFWVLLLAALSPSVLYAVERANIDVAIYLFSLGAAHLLLRGGLVRIAGYAVIVGAAAIKFYPVSLMALAMRETFSRFIALTSISMLAALILTYSYYNELNHVVNHLPDAYASPFLDFFSASRLPEGIAWIVSQGKHADGLGIALKATLQFLLAAYVTIRVWKCVPVLLLGLQKLLEREKILLVAGSLLILFCFFLGQNIYFRQIFLILTIPGVLALQREATDHALRNYARFSSWVVVAILWSEFFRYGAGKSALDWFGLNTTVWFGVWFGVWLFYEILWWWLASVLVAVVLCFAWDSRTITQLRRATCDPGGENDP